MLTLTVVKGVLVSFSLSSGELFIPVDEPGIV